ncbi:helix-turn-helix domain-containing protein [Pseudomonas bohemica]|uniref:helix-turn-helix domain-containing protein n=1 Tax=Pseudomonas bohemica TaxID=2044872 RepID=UPI000DA5F483|nr:AraC family transcriptional regulator [Pseudomonas bohemica]
MKLFTDDQVFRFGAANYERGGSFGPLRGPYLWVAMVDAGSSELQIDGRSIELQEGEACLVYCRNHVMQQFPIGCQSHASWCETGEFLDTEENRALLTSASDKFAVSPRLRMLLTSGLDLETEQPGQADSLRDVLAKSVFYESLRVLGLLPERTGAVHRSVSRAKSYIERHYVEPCTLDRIAAYACLSPQHLTRLFNEQLGQSPIQFLWRHRLHKAEELLIQSTRSISDIAFQCGFKSPAHFSRLVTEHFGHSPRTLRHRAWARMPAIYRGEARDIHY